MNLKEQQIQLCQKFKTKFVEINPLLKVGISENVRSGLMPINGLRHPAEGDTSGWYIWAGKEWSEDPDFFKPLHISHLEEWCPLAMKYLGLPPGWRFLTDGKYEDVWEDKSLLSIDGWVYVNGGKIDKTFLEENIAEAKQHSWKETAFPLDNDHSHCIICSIAVPDKDNLKVKNYKSKVGWLCQYCYENFLNK